MAPMGRLVERLFGAWVRQVTPATLRADTLANSLAVALGLHRFRRPWPYLLTRLVTATALAWLWQDVLLAGLAPEKQALPGEGFHSFDISVA